MIWVAVPPLIYNTIGYWSDWWKEVGDWINPALYYVAVTSPIQHLWKIYLPLNPATMVELAWAIGLQVAAGLILITIAGLRLRPSARNEGGQSKIRWVQALTQKRSWFRRPAVGLDAMMWKELRVARTGGIAKIGMLLVGAIVACILVYIGFQIIVPAFDEIAREGYWSYGNHRQELNIFIRVASGGVYVLWGLGVASSAASSLTAEREEDQWTSLTSTPLSGNEILRAKLVGSLWAFRIIPYGLLLTWLFGLAMGSLNYFGVVVSVIEFVVFSWFIAALGTFFSLRAKNTTRALASTMAVIIAVNGGYLFCCIPLRLNTTAIAAGCTPFLLGVSLCSTEDLSHFPHRDTGEMVVACVLGVLFYGVTALGLTTAMFTSFDAVVDRPDRLRQQNRTLRQRAEMTRKKPSEVQFLE